MRRECSSQEAGERLEEVTLAGDCAASMSKGECIGHDGVCVHGTNGYIPLVVFFGDIAGAVLYTVRHGGNRDVEFFQFEGGERCCCRLTPGIHLGGHGARTPGSPRGVGRRSQGVDSGSPYFFRTPVDADAPGSQDQVFVSAASPLSPNVTADGTENPLGVGNTASMQTRILSTPIHEIYTMVGKPIPSLGVHP